MTKYILFKIELEFEEVGHHTPEMWTSPLIDNSHHMQRVYDRLKEIGYELLPDSFAVHEKDFKLIASGKAIPITGPVGRARSFGGLKEKLPVKSHREKVDYHTEHSD